MCGIAGFFGLHAVGGGAALAALGSAMADQLAHRGPDDTGVWSDPASGTVLAHRRLSILDLSPAGHQPMVSACGRYVIAYNGEIFNHGELRAALVAQGMVPRSASDTEIILESCARHGVEATCRQLVGMFAFALWDRKTREVWLARDRMGIKPLYWQLAGGRLAFGSELKALAVLPDWQPRVDRVALTAYLRFCYVPAPLTIWDGVRKLEPGTILRMRAGMDQAEISRFWDLREEAREAMSDRLAVGDDEAIAQLDALLRDAVGRRMVADVPLGAFLSGGIDSSAVVALMQAQSRQPIKTFSIGFSERAYDESPHARAVAAHLGTDHTELIVEPEHALAVIPDLPRWYDEPFGDSSQIPTLLVSALARRRVSVSLSGDGGDELFAGYTRYFAARRYWPMLAAVPAPLRRLAGRALAVPSPTAWDHALSLLPARFRPSHPGDRVHKLADAIGMAGPDQFYRRLLSHWHNPAEAVVGGHEPGTLLDDRSLSATIPDYVERMQFIDMMMYLPDDILVKVDRASMAHGLEARVPLLDHRVVQFALRLPRHLRFRQGQGKWLLRQVLNRYVPPALTERPKMGFGVPIDRWLRGPLRDWAENLLAPHRLTREGFLNAAVVRRLWEQHLEGTMNHQYALWDVLMFQAWLESRPRDSGRPDEAVATMMGP